MSKASLPLVLTVIVTISIFFITTHICPPLSDDYWHGYLITSENEKYIFSTVPVDFGNYFQNIWNYRIIFNFRLANVITIFISSLHSKLLFSILNSLILYLSLYFASKTAQKKLTCGFVATFIAILYLFFPSIFGISFWMSGSINYLWGGFFLLYFFHTAKPHLIFHEEGKPVQLGVILSGFICSLWHEAISLPLLASLILFALFQKDKINKRLLLQLIITFMIGCSLLISAPSLWERANAESTFSYSHFCSSILMMGYKCFFPLVTFLILCWKNRKSIFHDLIAIFAIVSFCFALLVGIKGAWGGGYFYFCFSVLIWLLSTLREDFFHRKYWVVLSCCIALFAMLHVCYQSFELNRVMKRVVSQAKHTHIVDLDYKPTDAGLYFGLRRCLALPYDKNYYFTHAGKYHGVQNFITVWNDTVTDNSTYKNFNATTKGVCIQKTAAGDIVIQLPEDWACDQLNSPVLYNTTTGSTTKTRANEYWHPAILHFLYKHFPKIYRAPIGMDIHNGRCYVILPAPTERFSKITMGIFNIHSMDYKYETVDLTALSAPKEK